MNGSIIYIYIWLCYVFLMYVGLLELVMWINFHFVRSLCCFGLLTINNSRFGDPLFL